MMLHALIVDDEPPARKRLRKLLRPFEEAERLRVVDEAEDGVTALDMLDEEPVDVLFLDIQMPELNGFDVLQRLDGAQRPAIIFVTAYDEYAIRAFEENAVDYLLKPIDQDRLEEAVSRVESTVQTNGGETERLTELLEWVEAQQEDALDESASYLEQITVPYRDRILVKSVEDLVSVEIEEGIVRLFFVEEDETSDQPQLNQYMVDYTLDQLESNLDPDHFMRVHRSSIVQLDHIQEMISWFSGRYKLVLTTGHEVIASRQRSKELKERLML